MSGPPRPLVWGLLIVLALWVAFHSRDLPAVDDEDLCVRSGSGAALGEPWSSLLTTADRGTLAELRVAVDRLLGSRAPLEIPLPAATETGPPVIALIDRADEMGASAESAWSEGDRTTSLSELERILALGQRLAQARGAGLLETIAAVKLQGAAFDRLERWAVEPGLTDRDRAQHRAQLRAHRVHGDRWGRIWAAEYEGLRALASSASAQASADSGLPGFLVDRANYFYHPKRTWQELAMRFRATGEAYQVPCDQEPAPSAPPEVGVLTYVAPNAIGRILISFSLPDGSGARRTLCRHLQRTDDLVAALETPAAPAD